MDEFKDLEEEINKLDEGFSGDDFISRLRSPAGGDYWKKRLEDEKESWNKTVESREQENKRLEKKLQNTEEELKSVQKRLSEMELGAQKESREWEERVRNKDMELFLEKERAVWSVREKELAKENEGLKAVAEELKALAGEAAKNAELRAGQAETTHMAEMAQLQREQGEIVAALETMEEEISKLQADAGNRGKEISSLKKNIEDLNAQKILLENIIKIKEEQLSQTVGSHNEQIEHLTAQFSANARKFSGTLLGIIDFCAKRMERKIFPGATALKRQMLVAGELISEMLESINKIKTKSGVK